MEHFAERPLDRMTIVEWELARWFWEEMHKQQESEIYAENAWLRAAEYDPRMDNPKEW